MYHAATNTNGLQTFTVMQTMTANYAGFGSSVSLSEATSGQMQLAVGAYSTGMDMVGQGYHILKNLTYSCGFSDETASGGVVMYYQKSQKDFLYEQTVNSNGCGESVALSVPAALIVCGHPDSGRYMPF
jgi:hypothetical protein